jgi:4-diphosphocytidyl-2-C-methyl-D-erythritol kinase
VTAAARVLAQAKINLWLRVLAREASGYHTLETVFLRLELADRLTVRVNESGCTLDCVGPAIPPGGLGDVERNLAFRAARAYAAEVGWPGGFSIELEKNIPVGAGLGGGSADAGAVLRALDELSPRPIGTRLAELGGQLGADVPFMTLESVMALAWGRGDRLLPLPPLPPRPVLLGVPDVSVSTADAYAWLDATRTAAEGSAAAVISPASLATWDAMAGAITNDFGDVVARRISIIGSIIDVLRRGGAQIAQLSGSGSAVFGVFSTAPNVSEMERIAGARWIETRTAERVVRVEQNR